MKRTKKISKAVCLLFCLCVMGLTACGKKSEGNINAESGTSTEDGSKTSISVNKDGSITSKIVEDFGENYYDIDGLKTMIETSITEYQQSSSSAKVQLKKCSEASGVVKVHMEFGDYQSYAGFNEENFFAGTVQAANQAGFDLNITLHGVASEGTSISKPELMGMGSNHIVFVEAVKPEEGQEVESIRVNCFDEILYVSEGVTVVDKKSADVKPVQGYGIIVFK